MNQDYISYRLGASGLIRSAKLLVCLFVLLLMIVFATPFWAVSFFLPFIIFSLLSWDVMGKCSHSLLFTWFQCSHTSYLQKQATKKRKLYHKSLESFITKAKYINQNRVSSEISVVKSSNELYPKNQLMIFITIYHYTIIYYLLSRRNNVAEEYPMSINL